MFRRVVPLQLVSNAFSLLRRECFIQGPHTMYVQVVSNQHHLLGMREVLLHQHSELTSKDKGSAVGGHFCSSPTPQRLTSEEDVGAPLSFVLVVLQSLTTLYAGLWRQRLSLGC